MPEMWAPSGSMKQAVIYAGAGKRTTTPEAGLRWFITNLWKACQQFERVARFPTQSMRTMGRFPAWRQYPHECDSIHRFRSVRSAKEEGARFPTAQNELDRKSTRLNSSHL